MYIRDLVGSLTRPVLELKGFEMINLKPNETKKISFTINEKTIEYFTANKKWEAEPGDFKLFIGGSSDKTKETNFKYSN
jgi:beta-glucosidase